jgi:hypothetical protein
MRKIVSAVLLPGYNLCVEFDDLIDEQRERTKKPSMINIAHEDLVKAFQDLAIDLAAVCEQHEYTEMEKNAELLSAFHVTAIKLSKKGEEAIEITGTRMMKTHQYLALQTPTPIKLDPKISEYPYAGSLSEKANTLLQEIDMYITSEKKGDANAVGMFADQELNSHLSRELPEGVMLSVSKGKKQRGNKKQKEETAE